MIDNKGRFMKGNIPWSSINGFSEETRKKMSESAKGRTPWNKGKKGQSAYWKGKKMPKSACEKMKKADRTLTSGKNHYNWKGGITPLITKIRNSEEYKEWRRLVFEKDNYICVLCNSSGYINADHYPLPFAKIMIMNNIKTFEEALLCEYLWDVNNGRTLCLYCHKKTDTYAGRIRKLLA